MTWRNMQKNMEESRKEREAKDAASNLKSSPGTIGPVEAATSALYHANIRVGDVLGKFSPKDFRLLTALTGSTFDEVAFVQAACTVAITYPFTFVTLVQTMLLEKQFGKEDES